MLVSVVIPAHDQADGIASSVTDLHEALATAGIEHERLAERTAEVRMGSRFAPDGGVHDHPRLRLLTVAVGGA